MIDRPDTDPWTSSAEAPQTTDGAASTVNILSNDDGPETYAAALNGVVLHEATNRGLIEITGRDRAAWLSNLVTNTVRDLLPGEGNYTFATDVRGRILLDFNMLMTAESILLDIDRRLIPAALAHFNKYTITEQVGWRDCSPEWTRLVLLGPQCFEIAAALGAGHAPAMAALNWTTVPLRGQQRMMVRHDEHAGVPGLEFHIPLSDREACLSRLIELGRPLGIRQAGAQVVRALRIEAGIPLCGEEIDPEVLPAETGQLARAVSHTKGCYLGQEVIERMRSHQAIPPRTLVGLCYGQEMGVGAWPAVLRHEARPAGRAMGAVWSWGQRSWIGLGYVRTALIRSGLKLSIEENTSQEAEVRLLPMRTHGRGS